MQFLTLSLLLLTSLATVNAFSPPSTIRAAKMQSMELNAIDTSLIDVYDMTVSRTAFFLCLFGATGSAAMGRVVIPKTWQSYLDTRSLIGTGTPLGGRVSIVYMFECILIWHIIYQNVYLILIIHFCFGTTSSR